MKWMSIDSAPRDGTPVAYPWRQSIVSTCAWLEDAIEPGWWDLRAEEPASPTHWRPIAVPASIALQIRASPPSSMERVQG